MADRYWVGGTGNWSDTARWSTTSGGASGASVPGAADTAIFDANSDIADANFTATVDVATTISILTFGAVTCDVTIGTAGNLTVSTSSSFAPRTGANAGAAIISGNASLGAVTHSEGILNIDGNTVTMTSYTSTAANTRTFDFGTNGTVNITGNNATVWAFTTDGNSTISGTGAVNLTYSGGTGTRTINHLADTGTANASFKVSAGTDTVVFTANNSIGALDFTGFSGTWNNVALTVGGSLTVSTGMTVGAGAGTLNMSSTGSRNLTSNGKTLDFPLTSTGVGGTLTLQDALTLGSTRAFTLTSGTLSFGTNNVSTGIFSSNNSNIRTLNFGTAKLTLTGNNATIFDAGTATNFTTSGTVYIESTYTGGTGTRTFDTGFTQAQAAGYDVKTSGSSGIVIGTTATDIVALTGNYGNIDLTGFTNTLANTARTTYGTFIIPASGGTFTGGTSATTFGSTSSQTFTSNGRTIDFPLTVNGVGGSLTIQDALTLGSTRTLTLTAGTFNANNYNVTIGAFSSSNSNTRTLTMGSGLWSLASTGTVWNTATTTNLTFNKDTANIILTDTTTSSRSFSGGGLTYNKLTIGGATGISTTSMVGSNTFSELASTKTVAHTIDFAAGTNTSVEIWSVNGSAGNVVTLAGDTISPPTLTKLGGGYLSGYDYFNIDSVIGLPTDTWYVGSNSTYSTTTNRGYGFFTVERSTRAIVLLTSTASTTWTVPADWNNTNSIVLIGGGGGGGGSKVSGTNTSAGAGGGGGGCTLVSNQSFSVGSNITYQCGSAGTGGIAGGNGVAGGTTSWNSGASTAGGGGGGTSNAATPSSTGGTAGTGTTFNGGVGGAGSTTTANATTRVGGGGGGGAAGFDGAGKNGGNGFATTLLGAEAGGGGGGSNGGTAGGNASASTGGTGGNNFDGVGGGASNTSGAVGGGGGGSTDGNSFGGAGVNQFGVGSGGGGGGADGVTRTNIGGTFGGGGGGAGQTINPTTLAGSDGAQGAIIISYQPSPVSSGNFFQIF